MDGVDRVEFVVDERIDGIGFDGLLAPPRMHRRGGRPVHGRAWRASDLPLVLPGRIPEMEVADERAVLFHEGTGDEEDSGGASRPWGDQDEHSAWMQNSTLQDSAVLLSAVSAYVLCPDP